HGLKASRGYLRCATHFEGRDAPKAAARYGSGRQRLIRSSVKKRLVGVFEIARSPSSDLCVEIIGYASLPHWRLVSLLHWNGLVPLWRQCRLKYCPPRLICTGPQLAAVRLDDRPADRQTHAQSGGLGGVEGLENAVRTCEVQARARVPNGNEHAARSFRLRTDQQFARLRSEIAHRLG